MTRSPSTAGPPNRGVIAAFLAMVERAGNFLPHPATLFLILSLLVLVLSAISAQTSLQVQHPATGETVRPVSLLTVSGLHRIISGLVSNFTGFAPLGTVLVALLGIGVAESSGLIATCMRLFVNAAPRSLLTTVIVFAGVLSNTASEIGYVLLVPLSAVIFQAAGRHPLAGLAASFAGVSGGYSANLVLGTIDPLLAGLTQEAARILDPAATVNPACNYFFMIVSTFLVTILGTVVTERIVAPRLGPWTGDAATPTDVELRPLTALEKRGLLAASVVALLFLAVILGGTVPTNGYLRGPDGDLLNSPFLAGIVAWIFVCGAGLGIAYGVAAGTVRRDTDVMKGMARAMSTLGEYLVLVFFAAQFVAYFNWTNLGLIFAVEGSAFLKSLGLNDVTLLIGLALMTALVNLFMGSASAKWAVMAPVFVPMFMGLGHDPAMIQAAYRVGDSCTNIISPGMSYFALIIAFFQRYDPRAGIGTLVATMLPYSVAFFIGWIVLLVVWVLLKLPFGF